MSPETKKQAQEKLAKFRRRSATPASGATTRNSRSSDDLVGNLLRAYVFENEYQLSKVGKPIDPEQGMTPQTVNAHLQPGA